MPSEEKLRTFVSWYEKHIRGDEKGEAQIFLDRLFQAFGQGGALDVGGSPEFRIRKAKEDGGGICFADYVWKPVVLIEMKKRGTPLRRHLRQAYDYWFPLVPSRPRYVVLCNFSELWVFDFDTDIEEPKDIIATKDLAERWGSLAFLAPGSPAPVFQRNRVAVTQGAADVLAKLFTSLVDRRIARSLAQRFVVQNLVALFSQDIGLLPKYFYTRLLKDCTTPAAAYDLIGGLFQAMNTNPPAAGGRFKEVAYFNGDVFAEPSKIELTKDEIGLLNEAANRYDWAGIQPEIFGTLLQHSLDRTERRALGAHFTHPSDIMKVVEPTIVEPWRQRVEGARTLTALKEALVRLHNYRVLDPACGSGNFLYVAYRELKRIEARIIERMQTEFKREARKAAQLQLSFLTARNFFGLDIHPLAIEIAKVTMVVARKLASDELHITEPPLPLHNLNSNFQCADALLTKSGAPARWPKVDVIIGNPPFIGAKRLRPERSSEYVDALRRAYPDIPGMADYCVYWFRRAHDHLPACTADDPVAGRAGLVGTQNIRHNQSRVGGLDHIVESGTIIEAVDNQPWPGEAHVNVSIVSWAKTQDSALLPEKKRLWFVDDTATTVGGPAAPGFYLDFHPSAFINSSLTNATDVTGAAPLQCNTAPQRAFQGVTPGHAGFVLTPAEHEALVAKDRASATVVFPYLVGRELMSGDGRPRRYLIDLGARTVLEAKVFAGAFARIKATVLPDRKKKAEQGKNEHGDMQLEHKQALEQWWRLWRDREEMKQALARLKGRYIAASRTQRWPFIFCFVREGVLPGDKIQVFAFDDDYSFGIIQGRPHLAWYAAKAARLKNEKDYNYSTESVFDTYPWPQKATSRQIDAIVSASRRLRQVRTTSLPVKGGLRGLYSTLALPGANPLRDAHRDLDNSVIEAYGFSKRADLLVQLLELNAELSARIEDGKPVVGPGSPAGYPKPDRLLSSDCIG